MVTRSSPSKIPALWMLPESRSSTSPRLSSVLTYTTSPSLMKSSILASALVSTQPCFPSDLWKRSSGPCGGAA
ncbi:hypothetical protein KSP39_PZI004458 [Platanthera zijinensis]|uniref:Uncharacterized protein n=1 Tax=Platanthera zijinensis TaxID=2320716 RepID=A0AAP0BW26_9ASPA